MDIPIKNIYFLLCFAWNKLEEKDLVDVEAIESNEIVDLFASVLISATSRLLRLGLDRYYIEQEHEISGVKGKIDLALTIKKNKLSIGRTICIFDEFEHNILHNQILKTTISRLRKTKGLDSKLNERLRFLERNFPIIDEIRLNSHLFKQVSLHRNNYHYDFILKICKLIFEIQLINEDTGSYKFKDFVKDRKKMAELFEAFVRNYYKIKHPEFSSVKSDIIKWKLESLDEIGRSLIPQMKTDITLTSDSRKIIIDTKYYPKALVSSREGSRDKFISHHLYQITSYLINQEETNNEITMNCEGILLYPVVNDPFKYEFQFKGHKIRIMTIDLGKDWKEIEKELDGIVRIIPEIFFV